MSDFDCVIMCENEEECSHIAKALRESTYFSTGYYIKEQGRTFVSLGYMGDDAHDETEPPMFRALTNLLIATGFEQTFGFWGSRRFQKARRANRRRDEASESRPSHY